MNPASLRPRSAEQFAGAYAFADRIVIVTYGRVADGALVQGAVCFTVRLRATEKIVGYGGLQALEVFLPVYAPPKDFDARRRTQLKALGVRTERELQRHALYCSFHRVPGRIEFLPTHNGGHKGDQKGYQPLTTGFAIPDGSEIADVGVALRQAFKLCTTVFL